MRENVSVESPKMLLREDSEAGIRCNPMKEKEAADRIIAPVYEHVGEFSARLIAPVSPKQFAAAGLMRCCRLLNGIFVLYEARMPELAGILARQLWEAWVVSLYVLLAKDEAMKVIDGDDFYRKSRIVDYLGVEDDYYQSEPPEKPAPLNYKKLNDRVLELLRGRELIDCPSGATTYDVVQRLGVGLLDPWEQDDDRRTSG